MPFVSQYLLCTDLDRTVLPNGPHPESPQARPYFKKLAAHPDMHLAYVSGRDKKLLMEAIVAFDIPVPDYAIGDVGTSIYEIHNGTWRVLTAWHKEIGSDWQGMTWQDLSKLFADIDELRLQEKEKQNTFKLSYYTPELIDQAKLLAAMQERLTAKNIRANLIWSVDEMAQVGLLDVLPKKADKLRAIRFLMKEKGFGKEQTVFAGDSGNDLAVLTSGLNAVLVKNAHADVQNEAIRYLASTDQLDRLYVAHGNFLEMNGNYVAGVLEGLAHYKPHITEWLTG